MTTQTNSDEQFSQWFEDAFPERMYKDKQERELLMVSTWLAWRAVQENQLKIIMVFT